MTSPLESSPAYVARCLEELLDVIWGALDLVRSEPLDKRVAEAIRDANALLDIVKQRVMASPEDLHAVEEARDRVNAAGASFASRC
jgi:hypothetical protein